MIQGAVATIGQQVSYQMTQMMNQFQTMMGTVNMRIASPPRKTNKKTKRVVSNANKDDPQEVLQIMDLTQNEQLPQNLNMEDLAASQSSCQTQHSTSKDEGKGQASEEHNKTLDQWNL